MRITTYTRLEAEEVLDKMNELLASEITVSFSSFVSEKTGDTVFSCKLGQFKKFSGYSELAKGYGDHMVKAFEQAYQKLNEGRY